MRRNRCHNWIISDRNEHETLCENDNELLKLANGIKDRHTGTVVSIDIAIDILESSGFDVLFNGPREEYDMFIIRSMNVKNSMTTLVSLYKSKRSVIAIRSNDDSNIYNMI